MIHRAPVLGSLAILACGSCSPGPDPWFHAVPLGAGNPAAADFRSVWTAGDGDAWMVGPTATLAHWGGAALVAPAPRAPGEPLRFDSVWGASPADVWAAGAALGHWDGQAWSVTPSPVDAWLCGVWSASATDAWVVGSGGAAARWDGRGWSRATVPTSADLNAVWGSAANDVWAVGDTGTAVHYTY